MATLSIKVQDDQVRELLTRIGRRVSDLKPVMREIGEIVRESVMRNFAEGRSPEGVPWKRSRRAIRQGGRTLVDRAILRNSINARATSKDVRIGTPIEYGPVHQFGAARGSFGTVAVMVRAHVRRSRKGKQYQVRQHSRNQKLPWGDIPARPFLGVRREDWSEIHATLMEYLIEGS